MWYYDSLLYLFQNYVILNTLKDQKSHEKKINVEWYQRRVISLFQRREA